MNRWSARSIILIAIIAVTSLALSALVLKFNILMLENRLFDYCWEWRGPVERSDLTVIVAIDEESLQRIGNWPWPRSTLARLLTTIKAGQPRVIGIDLALDRPTPSYLGRGVGEDSALALALATPPLTVMAVAVGERELFTPLDIFTGPTVVTAGANRPERTEDDILREFQPIFDVNGTRLLSFPLALSAEYLGLTSENIGAGGEAIHAGRIAVPTRSGLATINYSGLVPASFSAADVLDSAFDPNLFFSDRIVLIGRTDSFGKDEITTPLRLSADASGRRVPWRLHGVEVWKEIIEMILSDQCLTPAPLPVVGVAMLLIALMTTALSLHTVRGGAALTFMVCILSIAGSYQLFSAYRMLLPPLHLAVPAIIAFLIAFIHNYAARWRAETLMTAAFKRYVSPAVMDNLLRYREGIQIGGQRKQITILFSDIADFTRFSDEHEAEEVLDLLKEYFAEMNSIIIRHRGMIDKLMGDGILALFGDIIESEDHAMDAVRAALEMQRTADALSRRLKHKIAIRIGISTGYATVGNVGSDAFMDYTAIGRSVNLASRLEAACQPGEVLISENTWRVVESRIHLARSMEIEVKGFGSPVKVFAIKPEENSLQ